MALWVKEHGQFIRRGVYQSLEELKAAIEGESGVAIPVVGHTDGVINDTYLLECKAIKDWATKNKWERGNIPAKYVAQAKAYAACLDLKGSFLVAKNRHTSRILLPSYYPVDMSFVPGRLSLFQRVMEAIENPHWTACVPLDKDDQRWCDACKVLKDV